MQTLVAIKNGIIQTTVGNWNYPDRMHLQSSEQNRIISTYGDVIFVIVNDDTQENLESRNLQPGWSWDEENEIGIEPVIIQTARETLESANLLEETCKSTIDPSIIEQIADGTYAGTDSLQILANAVLYLVTKFVTKEDATIAATEASKSLKSNHLDNHVQRIIVV